MDWNRIGKKLAKHGLNLLGSAIPGGKFVTGIVADILDCDDNPTSIDKALKSANAEKYAQLKKLEMEHKEKLQSIILANEVAIIEQVNKTMRSESRSDKWWQSGWRPFWGFASGLAFFVIAIMVCILAYQAVLGGNPNALSMIPQFITTMATLFAIPGAILGITSWGRNKEKLKKLEVSQ